MINTRFEAYKIKREIKRSGHEFTIFRNKNNEFGENTEEAVIIGNIVGLYHEQNSYIKMVVSDTTRIRTEKIPMILCLFLDVERISLKPDDYIIINNKTFKITGIVNIQEWNIIADISLEVQDVG